MIHRTRTHSPSLVLVTGLLLTFPAFGGCIAPETEAAAFDKSRSVAEVEVVSSASFLAPDQSIRTRQVLRLVERFKGDVPDRIEITSPGGSLGERTDLRSDSLPLQAGKSYVLLLSRDAEGTWSAHPQHAFRAPANRREMRVFFRGRARGPQPVLLAATTPETGTAQGNAGGVPGSVVTPTGYSEISGQPTRFSTCDGDEPIPYLIDIDPSKLPTGMTQAGAIAAVAEAVNAWAASSSLKFRFEGTQSFGTAATSIAITDRKLRIQLHDNYNVINTVGVLGTGGGSFTSASATFAGGVVAGQGFQERLYGFVVLESTTNAPTLLNTATFKRVLTHEIGHALGLDHSSNNAAEPDAVLKAATMYYTTPAGATGATIQTYDVDRIQFGYPVANTPPYTTDRVIPIVTTHSSYGTLPVGVLGANRIQLRATDRQGTVLTASLTSSTASGGTFSLTGTILTYTPSGFYDTARLTDDQIAGGTYYDSASIQFSDGVNLSRAVNCVVPGWSADTTPSDGLPDAWMIANFGTTAVGALGSGRHPDDDPDKDGLSNRYEWYLNTNPNSAASGPIKPVFNATTRSLTFTPVRFAPYWIESSSTLASGSWVQRRVGTVYQASTALTADFTGSAAPAKEFYRVATAP